MVASLSHRILRRRPRHHRRHYLELQQDQAGTLRLGWPSHLLLRPLHVRTNTKPASYHLPGVGECQRADERQIHRTIPPRQHRVSNCFEPSCRCLHRTPEPRDTRMNLAKPTLSRQFLNWCLLRDDRRYEPAERESEREVPHHDRIQLVQQTNNPSNSPGLGGHDLPDR